MLSKFASRMTTALRPRSCLVSSPVIYLTKSINFGYHYTATRKLPKS